MDAPAFETLARATLERLANRIEDAAGVIPGRGRMRMAGQPSRALDAPADVP